MDKQLKKYQMHLEEMFSTFQTFCEENDIKVFLVGGSALGAFRHQGFIPWDDDIDVAMFREDFEKMEYCMELKGNRLKNLYYSPVEKQLFPEAPIGHLYDLDVVENVEDAPKVDIHPIDGVPINFLLKKIQQMASLIYYLGIYHLPVKNKGKFARIISKILLKLIPNNVWRILLKMCKCYFTAWSPEHSTNICSLFGVAGYWKEIMPLEWLLPLRKCDFDGYKFWVPNNRDNYLKRLYGNWKEFPDESRRKPQHQSYLKCKVD